MGTCLHEGASISTSRQSVTVYTAVIPLAIQVAS